MECGTSEDVIAALDRIRDHLHLQSRGQAMDKAITREWRRASCPTPVPADGGREEEVLARISAIAQSRLCSGAEVIRTATRELEQEMA